ncbi:MAG: ImmA/IrrE family metallo-endopeptidase [Nitrospirae bacterium]|nr:ImmA/IrrE family metallo-endopeptidase [Nitrospirota bacterium]
MNSTSIRSRQRFSAGHELGHWMRDRGKIAFSCTEKMFAAEWSQSDNEWGANRFAADLLLPEFMFRPRAKNREITFKTVTDLADIFQTSMTAAAIRLVEHGAFPAMLICTEKGRRRWFTRGAYVPEILWPSDKPGRETLAYELIHGSSNDEVPTDVSSAEWFDHPKAHQYAVRENSVKISPEIILTLLWWKNEQQILDLEEEENYE